jgi:hypothetical protein
LTSDKLKQTLEKYKTFFVRGHILPVKHDSVTLATDFGMQLQHCHWMLGPMQEMIERAENPYMFDTEKEREKLYRWLGFIQGVLWAQSICSVEDLKGDNRNGTTKV